MTWSLPKDLKKQLAEYFCAGFDGVRTLVEEYDRLRSVRLA